MDRDLKHLSTLPFKFNNIRQRLCQVDFNLYVRDGEADQVPSEFISLFGVTYKPSDQTESLRMPEVEWNSSKMCPYLNCFERRGCFRVL